MEPTPRARCRGIRRTSPHGFDELDIEDGDLRWDASRTTGTPAWSRPARHQTFADFEGYDGETETNVTDEHDTWGADCR